MVLIDLLHRGPAVFPGPERFLPERFEPSDAPVHKLPYAYMPFSAGPRHCIGQKFAMLQMKVVLASLVRRYRLTAVTQRDQLRMGIVIVLKSLVPVLIRFEPRQ